MKHDPLNKLLLEKFPKLKDYFKDSIYDLDTPSYNFYQELFVPYIKEQINKNDTTELNRCLEFVEEMLKDSNEQLQEIAQNNILLILYEEKDVDFSLLPLKEISYQYYLDWLKN